jgi:FtsP/CotA-like multicopper oxidase with cupredoxin domain
MRYLNRRQFILVGAAVAGGVLSTRYLSEQSASGSGNFTVVTEPGAALAICSQNGFLNVSLDAISSRIDLGGQTGILMSYNGQIPGPRLEARSGDRVRVQFTNRLPQPTNLHYHGLHISPTGTADNIFLSVSPDETITYEFTIPPDHAAGTFYYHPHLHGSVAEQIFAGLGGIFVVRGALDEIPEVRAAQEEFLFIKDFALDTKGRIPIPSHMDFMQGREGAILTVNGQINPHFSILSGGLLRLRLINASASRFYRLALEDHPFYLIATDGGAIAQPIELQELLLSPGERAEILVKGDRPAGQYRLLNLPYDRGYMNMMQGMTDIGERHRVNTVKQRNTAPFTQILATINYQGSVSPIPLPQQLIPVESLPEPVKTRRIELSMRMGMPMETDHSRSSNSSGMSMMFLFNGQPFDPNRVDASVKLGTVEDWELVNVDPDGMQHPFHLHVNPFQVISRNGQTEPYPYWKDTVLLRKDETVRIRIPFHDFAGKTVYHCHVLDHEDLGMMGIVEMQP